MFATLTSKGQVTLPKAIRDRLQLDAGATLDFQLQPDGTILVRAIKPDARRLRGLLRSPHPQPLSVEDMDQAVADHLKERHAAPASRTAARRKTARR